MQVPLPSGLDGLDGLADLCSLSGVDMRPTLLRVLTDLYVQKPAHTPDEDRHYTELALRLIEAVDVATRAAIAARLAAHPAPAAAVVVRLARDVPEVAGPLQNHPVVIEARRRALQAAAQAQAQVQAPVQPQADAQSEAPMQADQTDSAAGSALGLTAGTASELNELFLLADAAERRLILLNLDIAGAPAAAPQVSRDPHACERLEAAALARSSEDFVAHLGRSLHIPRAQAVRIMRDASGEPIIVAAKVLGMRADMLQRILLFLNPQVGLSVERVHALATLYEEMPLGAAQYLLAVWQALGPRERVAATHQPLLWREDIIRSSPRKRFVSSARPRDSGVDLIPLVAAKAGTQ